MDMTGARSVFEMGANAGWNLSAIKDVRPGVQVIGNDVNAQACAQAKSAGINVINQFDFNFYVPGKHELVFTAGVLIHIPPDDLRETMQALIDKSLRYVLAVEYDASDEEMIEYRGESNRLWKRPYGAMYEVLGLKVVHFTDVLPGFDRCSAWLMEK